MTELVHVPPESTLRALAVYIHDAGLHGPAEIMLRAVNELADRVALLQRYVDCRDCEHHKGKRCRVEESDARWCMDGSAWTPKRGEK